MDSLIKTLRARWVQNAEHAAYREAHSAPSLRVWYRGRQTAALRCAVNVRRAVIIIGDANSDEGKRALLPQLST